MDSSILGAKSNRLVQGGDNNSHKSQDKMTRMLESNLRLKYKTEKLSYDQLMDLNVELEVLNNEYERTLEHKKCEIFVLTQKMIDLESDNTELQLRLNNLNNSLNCVPVTNFTTSDPNYAKLKNESSIAEELSVDQHASLLGTLKKKKNEYFQQDMQELQNEKTKLKRTIVKLEQELSQMTQKIGEYEASVEEKDNIINILYQEIQSLKNQKSVVNTAKKSQIETQQSNQSSVFNTPTVTRIKKVQQRDNFTFNNDSVHQVNQDIEGIKKSHFQQLNSIKVSLTEFLQTYGIKEQLTKLDLDLNQDVDEMIQVTLKEIKYIVVNLRKINIIFKSLLLDFHKNIIAMFDTYLTQNIHNKVSHLSQVLQKLVTSVNSRFARVFV